ncbi:CheR family methyltransferase [Virgibacillus halophilus]|uniref:CheR family methyltransferase n=1 Tax=Tigheibacillus halophilus TaxID=361280 RepID=UPI00363B9E23
MIDDYAAFTYLIKKKLNIDLSLYKEKQMRRRLTSLRDKQGFMDFSSFFKGMEEDDSLLAEFTDRITINVSEFFRNPQRWEILRERIIPRLISERKQLSIWSAACSTGEEPYSLAITMKHFFPHIPFTIHATDMDENVLQIAKLGTYKQQALKEMPKELIHRYFTFENGIYTIDPALKSNITYHKHNLLADTYPKHVDLLVCRNVLIYFTEEAKQNIYRKFSEALTVGGILFVGSTEQIFHPDEHHFSLADTFFYRKAK